MERAEQAAAVRELVKDGHPTHSALLYTYEDVPADVAEMDEERGAYAYYSHNGRRISDFVPVKIKAEAEEALAKERRNPKSSILRDSIGQSFIRGDYVLTHNPEHTALELGQVVRNLPTKSVVRSFAQPWLSRLRTRNTSALLRIPPEFIHGGEAPEQKWTIQYKGMAGTHAQGRTEWLLPNRAAALTANGYFQYMNAEGRAVTPVIPIENEGFIQMCREQTTHGQKKLVEHDIPMTDAMGTDILVGDWVFSDDNHWAKFFLCEVVGFTRDRVRLICYDDYGRIFTTLNWSKNIIKLPVTIT